MQSRHHTFVSEYGAGSRFAGWNAAQITRYARHQRDYYAGRPGREAQLCAQAWARVYWQRVTQGKV